jgi:hypothetical protein
MFRKAHIHRFLRLFVYKPNQNVHQAAQILGTKQQSPLSLLIASPEGRGN